MRNLFYLFNLKYVIITVSLWVSLFLHAEINIQSFREQNVKEMLLNNFIGEGVEISNATFNGHTTIPVGVGSQIASFNNNGDCNMLNIPNGIMLSSSKANEIITNSTKFLIENNDVSAEDLYDFANNYLPTCYLNEIIDNYELVDLYSQNMDYLLEDLPEDKRNEITEKLENDVDFTNCISYFPYSKPYYENNGNSYEWMINPEYNDLYPIYAVYKLIDSWDTKYYTATEEELKNVKEVSKLSDFRYGFNLFYLHDFPSGYNKSKENLYKKIKKTICYSNLSNTTKDEDINEISGLPTYSPSILEFDFSTTDDSIAFNYVFGSQEYPDYVGSLFNDAFAFLITDLTTDVKKNMAIIPGTDQIVSINNVNSNINNEYFIENECYETDTTSEYVVVDYSLECDCNMTIGGSTTTLTAKTEVIPCRLYHLKIVIANTFDYNLQSAVFLEAGSFKSNGVSTKTKFSKSDANGLSYNCSNGEIELNVKESTSPTKIHLKHIGEAKNGIHYEKMPETVTIPANTESMSLDLIPLQIEEDSLEIVIVLERESECPNVTGDTIRTYIYNNKPITVKPNTVMCCDTEISAEITGKPTNIHWEPANMFSDNGTSLVHPINCPTDKDVYTLTVENKFSCQVIEKELHVHDCSPYLIMTTEFKSNNGTNNLVDNCNEGEIVFKIKRNSNTSDAIININYDDDSNIYGLSNTLTIPNDTSELIVPIKALKKGTPYKKENIVKISCANCTAEVTDTILEINTAEVEPLVLKESEYIFDCDDENLEITVPLVSGKIGEVTWSPSNKLKAINKLKATLTDDIEKETFTVSATDSSGCQTANTFVSVEREKCISLTAVLETRNKTSDLIANCNDGKLILNILRNQKSGSNTEISLTYDNAANIAGLNKEYSIPANQSKLEIPISSIVSANPYHHDVTIGIECKNCTGSESKSEIKLSTNQLETLKVGDDISYKYCENERLDIEIPLISGNPKEVVWEPMDALESADRLSATLKENYNRNVNLTVTAKDESGCQTAISHVKIIKDFCINLEIPPFFTPNNDGENDVWKIKGLENTEMSSVRVFDRWGKLLYKFNPNAENWDGTYNGHPCPSTDYWYEIDCPEMDKVYTGHFTLLR